MDPRASGPVFTSWLLSVDANATRFETKTAKGHSFAHHCREQQIHYLKEAGVGFFIVPTGAF